VERLTVATVEHICSLQHRSIQTFDQVLELEKAMGAEHGAALIRAMCASMEQFEQELIAVFEGEKCE
jgi:hypothetical protein